MCLLFTRICHYRVCCIYAHTHTHIFIYSYINLHCFKRDLFCMFLFVTGHYNQLRAAVVPILPWGLLKVVEYDVERSLISWVLYFLYFP